MCEAARLRLDEVEQRVCDIASVQLAIARDSISPRDRIIEDLDCDSLDLVELLMEVEDSFDITLPVHAPNAVYKAVFTRQPFRLSDLAELAYLQQGSGRPDRKCWRLARRDPPPATSVPFTQLGGRFVSPPGRNASLFERLGRAGQWKWFRRLSDGMRCVAIPAARVELGNNADDAHADERPRHVVEMSAFLIDAEPVSTTAYCRFLNSVGELPVEVLDDWLVLDPADDRNAHMVVKREEAGWAPLPGAERWPMILVSWYGARAYGLWAHGADCLAYRDEAAPDAPCFLPSEAQWEYAARGPCYRRFPWGDEPATDDRLRYGQHRKGARYRANTLPMADVNAELGISCFGLHHMAGNVWQWCSDWYDDAFYTTIAARRADPVNLRPTQARSERGGSWIGPADLCRSSFRRGRPPSARGRCLGFRCVGAVP